MTSVFASPQIHRGEAGNGHSSPRAMWLFLHSPVAQPECIGFPQSMSRYLITIARPFIGPYKYVPHKLNAVQFVNTHQPININSNLGTPVKPVESSE